MKRFFFPILCLSVFAFFGLMLESSEKTHIRKGENRYADILFKIDGPATTVEKGALAVAALRLSGKL
ncbi:MAG: hypothetical protein PVH61_05725 [Candidatus Aminicenantes bacterium]|jgi:hypothetical protein